jgi:hypothetical protein
MAGKNQSRFGFKACGPRSKQPFSFENSGREALNGRTARAARVRSAAPNLQELLMIKINAQLWMPS